MATAEVEEPIRVPLWFRVRNWFSLQKSLSAREAYLGRELENARAYLVSKEEENDRLRTEVRVLKLDVEVARAELSLYADVIERDRQRIRSEIAAYASKVVAMENPRE